MRGARKWGSIMEKGQKLRLKIEDITENSQGVGRTEEGMTVFVRRGNAREDALPGDTVLCHTTKVKKRFAIAELDEVLEKSPYRIDGGRTGEGRTDGGRDDGEQSYGEFCEYSDRCGGCPYGKLIYGKQLELKERGVREALKRIGNVAEPALDPIIGMTGSPYNYRNKAVMPVSTDRDGNPAVGFFKERSRTVVDCRACRIQAPPAMAAAEALRQFMISDHVTAYDPVTKNGLFRHLVVRTASGTGEVMVLLVINGKGIPNAEKLIRMLDDAIYALPPAENGVEYSLESVFINVNRPEKVAGAGSAGKERKAGKAGKGRRAGNRGRNRGGGSGKDDRRTLEKEPLYGKKTELIAGKSTIIEGAGGTALEISPLSFCQVNTTQMEALYYQVFEYAGLSEGDTVLDVYCGIGSIGLFLSGIMDDRIRVIGIESDHGAVLNANRNAVINGIVNARYVCGRAEDVLPELVADRKNSVSEGAEIIETVEPGEPAASEESAEASAPSLKIELGDVTAAILDPPRAGCDERLLRAVAAAEPARIVYVSCEPPTLARDVKLLRELGYTFVKGTPVDMFPQTGRVETVCLLSKLSEAKHHISVQVDMDELDLTSAESKATYEEIQEWVQEKYGFHVTHLNIAQMKRKHGIIERENYNKPKSPDSKQPGCPEEKTKAIEAALKHFQMI